MVVEAKKVALCMAWPISDASVMRLSRQSIACIQARRTPRRRAVMLRGDRRRWMKGP